MRVVVRIGNSPHTYTNPKKALEAASGLEDSASRYQAKADEYFRIAKALRDGVEKGLAEDAAKAAAKKDQKRDET